jgi:NADPH-dependent 2,4-dienoyl-CoA reductase/sulfur reductase-like enzyme
LANFAREKQASLLQAAGTREESRRFAFVRGVLDGQYLAMDGSDMLPEANVLKGNAQCDVALVGSGIAGLSTAYELSKPGQSVIVLDREGTASSMTARAAAHLRRFATI